MELPFPSKQGSKGGYATPQADGHYQMVYCLVAKHLDELPVPQEGSSNTNTLPQHLLRLKKTESAVMGITVGILCRYDDLGLGTAVLGYSFEYLTESSSDSIVT